MTLALYCHSSVFSLNIISGVPFEMDYDHARSCLYANFTRVRTHHFPLGLCPTPNWGLNYDPLPYSVYTSFPGWLRLWWPFLISLSFTVLWKMVFFFISPWRGMPNFPGLKLDPIFVLFLWILVVHVIPHFVLSFVENWRIENKANYFIQSHSNSYTSGAQEKLRLWRWYISLFFFFV